MSSVTSPIDAPLPAKLPWDLAWLSQARCRLGVAFVIALAFLAHLMYLHNNCPIDLAEDEAYYWDWSRQLDLSYYSKGPLTAWMIRGSCSLLGDTPIGVRFPALFMGAGLSLCVWWLTLRLFGSERLALGAVLLAHMAPMITAAGLIITTDPPFLFLWSLATCFAAVAIFDRKTWAWVATGAVVGMGFLTKFGMPIWLAGLFLFLLLDRDARPRLRSRWPYLLLLVATLFTPPVLIWNARQGWVTILHVQEDVGLTDGRLSVENIAAFWLGQMGVIGPGLFLLIMTAVLWGVWRQVRPASQTADTHSARAVRFLLCMSLPVFLLVLTSSFRHHPAENWPASSYFGLMILTAYFLSRQLPNPQIWRWLRLLFYPAVVTGFALVVFAHNTEILYPLVARFNARFPDRALVVRKIDPTHRLHGWSEVGQRVGRYLAEMGSDAMVFAGDYQTAAELAFYVPGQPRTRCAGSYFTIPSQREPFSQYNIWPDRRLDRQSAGAMGLLGRNAVYVGPDSDDIRRAFARVEPLPQITIFRRGLEVRRVEVWACYGFQGMPWPGWNGRYNK